MPLLPYIGSVINLGNSFSQATRPKHVGQMSDLIQSFRDSYYEQSVDGWESYYNDMIGSDKIEIASKKIYEYVQRIKANLEHLTEDDVYDWTRDLIINKTFDGLLIQLTVLELASDGKPCVFLLHQRNRGELMDLLMEFQNQLNHILIRKRFNLGRRLFHTI